MENIKPDNSKVRYNYIDLMEFLGILFVLLYHSTTYSFSWIDDKSALSLLRYFLRTILSTGVPLFFFANGYLLLNKELNLKKHIIKTIKIVILTGVWGIIDLLILMPIKKEYLSVKEFVSYLWNWQNGWINHLWYMGALVCIYVFFPLLKAAFDSNKKAFKYFTVLCAIMTFGNEFLNYGVSIIINIVRLPWAGVINTNWFNMFNPFSGIRGYAFVYFCVGGLAHETVGKISKILRFKKNITSAIIILLCCAGLFTMGVVLSNISGKMWDVVWNGYDTIFTFLNTCMIFVLCLSYRGGNKAIRLISCNTLGIYFIHEIFINLTKEPVKSIPIFQSMAGCAIYSFVILLICLAITLLFRKIPGVKKIIKL